VSVPILTGDNMGLNGPSRGLRVGDVDKSQTLVPGSLIDCDGPGGMEKRSQINLRMVVEMIYFGFWWCGEGG